MISLIDVIRGVAACFADTDYIIYDEPPTQEASHAVYISAEPISSEIMGGGRMADRDILIDLAYVTDGAMSRAQYYAFLTACDVALRPVIAFCGRRIMPTQIAMRMVAGVAHYTFTLSFYDALDVEQPVYAVMERLEVREM